MLKYEEKKCAHCATMFECKPGNITHCDCYSIELTTEERQFIASQYHDCLCNGCILTLKSVYTQLPLFYIDNRLTVFTEKFHLQRGHCCGSGCRHCPFKSHSKNYRYLQAPQTHD